MLPRLVTAPSTASTRTAAATASARGGRRRFSGQEAAIFHQFLENNNGIKRTLRSAIGIGAAFSDRD